MDDYECLYVNAGVAWNQLHRRATPVAHGFRLALTSSAVTCGGGGVFQVNRRIMFVDASAPRTRPGTIISFSVLRCWWLHCGGYRHALDPRLN